MADTYSAGNLEFKIQAVGKDTIASLNSVNNNLETMLNLVGGLSDKFTELHKSITGISKLRFNSVARLSKGLNEISSFNINKINLPNNKKTESVLGLNFSNIGRIASKLYFLRNITVRYFRALQSGLKNAIDYTETLNLWQVAMRGNRQEAQEFIATMNKAYGISEQTLMNYQAIFRNMLSSLGGISEDATFGLSKYLTQMALDYASLYNTTIQRAMTTFQSVLSGQVRPIRSIAGYDITETTIYQLYQSLGGTKTQRQLSQTEKRLLRIYAVFQQMERSGAIGDLSKTLNNTANQLRVMSETLKEAGQWVGILIETWVKPALPYLSATFMLIRDITKALAYASGYVPFEGGVEQTEEFNEELDKVQGKLLSFDKFEALNSNADNNALGIDETIFKGFEQYESILQNVSSTATDLYKQWRSWWFEIDKETGKERLSSQANNLLNILKALGIAIAYLALQNIPNILINIAKKIGIIITSSNLLNATLIGGIVYSITQAIEAFKNGDYIAGILASTIGVVLVGAFIKLNVQGIIKTVKNIITKLLPALKRITASTDSLIAFGAGLSAVAIAIGLTIGLFQNWDNMNSLERFIGLLGVLTTAAFGAALALGAFHSAWSIGLAAAAIIAGITATTAVITRAQERAEENIQYRKNGGKLEDGLFTMSKGEIIGSFDDGSTVVANNQQIIEGIKQGVYEAVSGAMHSQNGATGNVYLDGRKVGVTTAQYSGRENIRTGLVRVNR